MFERKVNIVKKQHVFLPTTSKNSFELSCQTIKAVQIHLHSISICECFRTFAIGFCSKKSSTVVVDTL